MASVVLGTIGGIIGGIYGGPIGAQLGYAAGAYLGGQIDIANSPRIEGPRLSDLKMTSSAYGNGIPVIYGIERIAGNMIWSLPIIEQAIDSGGKGATPPATNYAYFLTCAIALCDNEIKGIRRIWANGQLVYDVSGLGHEVLSTLLDPDAPNTVLTRPDGSVVSDINTVTTIESTLASLDIAQYMTVHYGTEDQLPSTTIEATEGEFTPAYRGVAYVVFERLPLEKLSKVINWEFEIVECGSNTGASVKVFELDSAESVDLPNATVTTMMSANECRFASVAGDGSVAIYASAPGAATSERIDGVPAGGTFENPSRESLLNIYSVVSEKKSGFCLLETPDVDAPTTMNLFDANTGVSSEVATDRQIVVYDAGQTFASVVRQTQLPMPSDVVSNVNWGGYIAEENSTWAATARTSSGGRVIVFKPNNVAYVPLGLGNISTSAKIAITSGMLFFVDDTEIIRVFDLSLDASAAHVAEITRPPGYIYAIFGESGKIWASTNTQVSGTYDETHGSIMCCNYASGERALTVISTFSFPTGSMPRTGGVKKLLAGGTVALVDSQTVSAIPNGCILIQISSPAPVARTTASIVSDICKRAGVPDDAIDVSQITGTVDGYKIANRGSARANIGPLMIHSYFDGAEIDDKIRFIARGSAASFDIPAGEIGAMIGVGDPANPLPILRVNDLELPNEVTVAYTDVDSSYVQGTQYARRLIKQANMSTTVQVPVVMSAQKAASIAAVALKEAWTARSTFSFEVGMKWTSISPCDTGFVTEDNVRYFVRITKKDESAGLIKIQAVMEDADLYTLAPAPIVIPSTGQTLLLNGPTRLFLLDIPLLQDANATPGMYAMAAGFTLGWRGARLFSSVDGITYGGVTGAGFPTCAFFGAATTILQNFSGGNVIDEISRVTVRMEAGALYSIADALLLAGGNTCLVAGEILSFRTATLIGGTDSNKIYVLSGLLRGRKGTEQYMGTHAAGDRFVLLDTAKMVDVPLAPTEIGVTRHYKSVTLGGFIEKTAAQSFTYGAANVKPLSPTHIDAGKTSAAGDLRIQWIRRSRIDQEWRDFGDVMLGEVAELYDVEIYDAAGAVLKRTFSGLTTSNTSYSAAERATDGTTGDFVTKVYQISNVAGRGFAGIKTIASL